MTTIKIKDADGADVYLSGTGAGTLGDPFVPANGGTVTANLSATDNAVLDAIVAALPAALAANGGLKIEGVAGGVAQPVSIATAPVLVAGTALIGKVGIDQTTANANEVVAKSGTITTVSTVTAVTDITNPVAVKVPEFSIDLTVAAAAAAYASGDIVGAEMTITNAARANGLGGKITGMTLIDYAAQSVAGELWITDTAVSEPADNAAWSITDAEAATVITVIPTGIYYASALNSVAPSPNLSIPFKCTAGTRDLKCCFVTRGTPTYVANGLILRIWIDQN